MNDQQKLDADLIVAVDNNQLIDAKTLISQGANVNQDADKKYGNVTLLMLAIGYDNYEMAEALLEASANTDVSVFDDYYECHLSALDRCLNNFENSSTESFVRLLHKHGANLNYVRDSDHIDTHSPLCYCIANKQVQLASVLIELGARMDLGMSDDDNALLVAKQTRSKEMISMVEMAILNIESTKTSQTTKESSDEFSSSTRRPRL